MEYDPSNHACSGDCPVEQVYRREAMYFANKISEIEELPNCYECIVMNPAIWSLAVEYNDEISPMLGYRLQQKLNNMRHNLVQGTYLDKRWWGHST